jgi:hypothetical protein
MFLSFNSNTTGATTETGTAYFSEHLRSDKIFCGVRVVDHCLSVCPLSFVHYICRPFFDVRHLITTLTSSNFSNGEIVSCR